MITHIILLLLLVLFPGFLISILFLKNQKIELVKFVFNSAVTGVLTTTLFSFLLFYINQFYLNYLLILNIGIPLGLFILKALFSHDKLNLPEFFIDKYVLVLFLTVTFVTLITPSFKVVTGEEDGYLYLNGAISMAKNHSFFVQDTTAKELNVEENKLYNSGFNFIPFYNNENYRLPATLHFIHVWIAIFYIIGGVRFAFFTNYLFNILGCIAFYYLCSYFLSRKLSFVASIFLLTNFVQVWFFKYPNTEIPFQFLTFTLILELLYQDSINGKTVFSIKAAVLIFLLLLTRIDAIIIVISVLFYSLYENIILNNKFISSNYLNCLIPSFVGSIYYFYFARNYILMNLTASDQPWRILLVIIILFITVILVLKKQRTLIVNFISKQQSLLYALLSVLVVIYFIFYKPALGFRINNFISLSWYISPIIVSLGIVGIFQLFNKPIFDQSSKKYIILFISMVPLSIIFLENIHNRFTNPWVMRRLIISAVPLLITGYFYFIDKLKCTNYKILIVVVLFTLGSNLVITCKIIDYSESNGVYEQISNIFSIFNENDRLIFLDTSYPEFSFPVKFILDKNVIMGSRFIHEQTSIDPISVYQIKIFLKIVKDWIALGRNVFIVNPNQQTINILAMEGLKSESYSKNTVLLVGKHLIRGETFPNIYESVSRNINIYQVLY